MAHVRRHFRSRAASPKSWDSTDELPILSFLSGIAAGALGQQAFFGTSQNTDITILRLRGSVMTTLIGTVGPVLVGVGVGVVTEQATAGGVNAAPRALQEADWDGWFYHQTFWLDGNVDSQHQVQTHQLDSKAMRRIVARNILFTSVQVLNNDLSSPATVETSLSLRGLFKTI